MPLKDAKLNFGPTHVNNNVICVFDIRTGGPDPTKHDLMEISILPLNHSYKPHAKFPLFQIHIKPTYPVDLKYARVSKPEFEENYQKCPHDTIGSAELFCHWVEKLELHNHKKIFPMAWDWINMKPWIKEWLGPETFDLYIDNEVYRDPMSILNFINDRSDYWNEPIQYVHPTFDQLCVRSNVERFDKNSLSANCLAVSQCYRKMLHNR